jgi:hypothetical protein
MGFDVKIFADLANCVLFPLVHIFQGMFRDTIRPHKKPTKVTIDLKKTYQ